MPRIYQVGHWQSQQSVELTPEAANHVGRVLRMRAGESLTLFNGDGLEYACQIESVEKRRVIVNVLNCQPIDRESPLKIHLYQALSKGERMEMVMQKAVELGVHAITPMLTARSVVRLDSARLEKKLMQWQKIIIGACEQCGRNTLPQLNPVIAFSEALDSKLPLKLILSPHDGERLAIPLECSSVALYIGPEGGFSDEEVSLAHQKSVDSWLLGPRILRTETAALTAISLLQYAGGDF